MRTTPTVKGTATDSNQRVGAPRRRRWVWTAPVLAGLIVSLTACPPGGDDAGVDPEPDARLEDAGVDSGTPEDDAGVEVDSGSPAVEPGADAGPDVGPTDAGPTDGGPTDGGPTDGGPTDGGPTDGGPVAPTLLSIEVIGWGAVPVPEGEITIGNTVIPIVAGRAELFDAPAGQVRGVVRAPGFAPASLLGFSSVGKTTIAQVRLLPIGVVVEFPADQAVELFHESVGVRLQPNSFVNAAGNAVTGVITASITAFDPATDMGAAPGPFRGIDDNDTMQLIETFGMGEFTFTQNGEELQLADGMTATVHIAIAPSSGLLNGTTIPSWSYDLEAGNWVQEQMGSVSGFGNRLQWVATVDHFTWWNVDRSTVDKECVILQLDLPDVTAGIPVYSDGIDYAGVDVSQTDEDGRSCVEYKRGSQARVQAGGGSHGFTYTLNVFGNGDPADCEGNGAGCSTVLIEVPELTCVIGQVQQGGIPEADADAILEYGSDLSIKRSDANGNFCALVPLSSSVHAFASTIDANGSYLTAEGNIVASGEAAGCGGGNVGCVDLGVLELSTPPQLCMEGQVAQIGGFSGVQEDVPVGTPLYAYRQASFTGVSCATTPNAWGNVIATGTVGMGGAYCLNLPLGEDTRDIAFAADGCSRPACETESPDAICATGNLHSIAVGDEVNAAGSQCYGAGTCLTHDILFE